MLLILPPPPRYFLSLLKIHNNFEVAGKRQFLTCSHQRRHRQRRRKKSSGLLSCPSCASCLSAGGLLPGPAQAPQCHKASRALPAQPTALTHAARGCRQMGFCRSLSEEARTDCGASPKETCRGKTCHSCPPVLSFHLNCLGLKSSSGGCPPLRSQSK